jgi:hypothetical protein
MFEILRFKLQPVPASGSMGVGRRAISASETREERKEPGEGLRIAKSYQVVNLYEPELLQSSRPPKMKGVMGQISSPFFRHASRLSILSLQPPPTP